MIGFQGSFRTFYLANFTLALTSTAIANALGSMAGADKKLATQSLSLVLIPQLLFAGFFVTPSLIPVWIRWVQFLAPLTYCIRILLVAEFDDCSPDGDRNCQLLLQRIEADPEEVWWYWLVLLGQFVAYRLLALWLLRANAQRFY
jgi:ABC-type multidrug transport system permease subunit